MSNIKKGIAFHVLFVVCLLFVANDSVLATDLKMQKQSKRTEITEQKYQPKIRKPSILKKAEKQKPMSDPKAHRFQNKNPEEILPQDPHE